MYRYQLDNHYERIIPSISVIYLPLSKNGFADILSINLKYTLKLKKSKNKINEINSNLWEDIKKYTNPYELIYIFNNKREQNIKSIAKFRPLSRSFFKMIEIIHEFIPNINTKNIINSLHIAEGPGGFIEATRFIRRENNNMVIDNDRAFGITLIDNMHKNVPAWKQSNIFLKNHPEVIISAGADGTGNIYNIKNILFLETQIKQHITSNEDYHSNMIDFITADGGFDYSVDYNYQEQASSKLIFSQIITALKYQKFSGDFVCKFFDINSYLTVEMLYILYLAYDKITIYKPYTSRIANSEKYIICNNYIGINKELLEGLFNILDDWNKHPTETINQLFEEIPISFIDKIKELNKILIDNQIQSISKIINIVNTRMNLKKDWKKNNLQLQINYAKDWCKRYQIPYNE